MELSDIIGSVGVTLILIAFLFNLIGAMARTTPLYLMLNLIGAVLACISSILIGFWPFVVLEGVWALAALIGLMRRPPAAATA